MGVSASHHHPSCGGKGGGGTSSMPSGSGGGLSGFVSVSSSSIAGGSTRLMKSVQGTKMKSSLGQTVSADDLLNVREKKKRRRGLSTLKKKFVGRKKNCRAADHAKHFKELFSSKPTALLSALLEHYEVLLAMRDLKIQADQARPPAPTLQQNLEQLFCHGHCPDFQLIYLGTRFRVHKSILLARCPYFKDLLLAAGSMATELTVRLATPGVDVPMFTSLLRFLYTGEYPSQEMSPHQIDLLISLGRECGVPNLLETDLEHLYMSGEHTDCILVFTGDGKHSAEVIQQQDDPDLESAVQLSCHKAVLCARSPFFRNLVSRRLQAAASERQDRGPSLPQPLRVVLDETVIPQKYARVLVRALYVDSIDFDLVDDRTLEMGDRVKDAMELYQIARFLDLDKLAQNCEDAIVQRLNQTNIVDVLEWGGQPYGSAWVNRQAHQYLLEDFVHVTSSTALDRISKETLRSVISSDFLQASESEILSTVIRWGECVVAKRSESEMTCSHTLLLPVSGGKRSTRRKEGICDREVAEVVCDLVGCVRLETMLCGTDMFKEAAERGLLSRPWYMVGGASHSEPWDPRCYRPPHQQPRLFLPYYEECKAILSERSGGMTGDVSSFNFHRISEIPDTLYMVRDERACSRINVDLFTHHTDVDSVSQMVRRVRKLHRTISVQRALASPLANCQQIINHLQLRVVREYNLPDSFTSVLQRAMDGDKGICGDTPNEDRDDRTPRSGSLVAGSDSTVSGGGNSNNSPRGCGTKSGSKSQLHNRSGASSGSNTPLSAACGYGTAVSPSNQPVSSSTTTTGTVKPPSAHHHAHQPLVSSGGGSYDNQTSTDASLAARQSSGRHYTHRYNYYHQSSQAGAEGSMHDSQLLSRMEDHLGYSDTEDDLYDEDDDLDDEDDDDDVIPSVMSKVGSLVMGHEEEDRQWYQDYRVRHHQPADSRSAANTVRRRRRKRQSSETRQRRHASLNYLPSVSSSGNNANNEYGSLVADRQLLTQHHQQQQQPPQQPLSDTVPDVALASASLGTLSLSRSVPSAGLLQLSPDLSTAAGQLATARHSPRPPSFTLGCVGSSGSHSPDLVEAAGAGLPFVMSSIMRRSGTHANTTSRSGSIRPGSGSNSSSSRPGSGTNSTSGRASTGSRQALAATGGDGTGARSTPSLNHSYRQGPSHMFL